MLLRAFFILALVLGPAEPARADVSGAQALALDARGGYGWHDDTSTAALATIGARGGTASNLALAGTVYPGQGRFGIAARLASEWVTLRPRDDTRGSDLDGSGGLAALGFALRAGQGRFAGELQLGYAGLQAPVVVAQMGPLGLSLAPGRVRAHGPLLSLAGGWQAAPAFAIELAGEAVPIGWGGAYAGVGVTVRAFRAGATVVIGNVPAGAVRLAALVGYQRGEVRARGDGAELAQAQQHFGLGLRARWRSAPAQPPSLAAPEPARLLVTVRERAADGRETERPLAGLAVEVRAGSGARVGAFTTDAQGAIALRDLAAGPIELRLGGAGFEPAREVLAFPAAGTASAVVFVSRVRGVSEAPASVAVSGSVRAVGGGALAARVRIEELGLEQAVDAGGAFRFDLPPGRYSLTVAAPGFVGQRRTIEAGGSEQQIYDLELVRERP